MVAALRLLGRSILFFWQMMAVLLTCRLKHMFLACGAMAEIKSIEGDSVDGSRMAWTSTSGFVGKLFSWRVWMMAGKYVCLRSEHSDVASRKNIHSMRRIFVEYT